MNMGSINSVINTQVISMLGDSLQYGALVVQSPYFLILAAAVVAAYLLHLARGLVSPKTLPHSSVFRPSPVAWTVPIILISVVIVKVVSVLR